jgi:molybdate transport system substrate-binding protein
MDARGSYVLLPADAHAPLEQKMVLLKNAGPTARAFAAFVVSPKGQAILARYGFEAPPLAARKAASPPPA